MKSEQTLSRRGRQIMEIVHRLGNPTVREITEELPDPPTEDSVRALLKILERKGLLLRTESKGKIAYAPAETPESAGRSALKRVLDTFFGGSLDAAVATFLTYKEADLSPEELRKLARRIREAKKDEAK